MEPRVFAIIDDVPENRNRWLTTLTACLAARGVTLPTEIAVHVNSAFVAPPVASCCAISIDPAAGGAAIAALRWLGTQNDCIVWIDFNFTAALAAFQTASDADALNPVKHPRWSDDFRSGRREVNGTDAGGQIAVWESNPSVAERRLAVNASSSGQLVRNSSLPSGLSADETNGWFDSPTPRGDFQQQYPNADDAIAGAFAVWDRLFGAPAPPRGTLPERLWPAGSESWFAVDGEDVAVPHNWPTRKSATYENYLKTLLGEQLFGAWNADEAISKFLHEGLKRIVGACACSGCAAPCRDKEYRLDVSVLPIFAALAAEERYRLRQMSLPEFQRVTQSLGSAMQRGKCLTEDLWPILPVQPIGVARDLVERVYNFFLSITVWDSKHDSDGRHKGRCPLGNFALGCAQKTAWLEFDVSFASLWDENGLRIGRFLGKLAAGTINGLGQSTVDDSMQNWWADSGSFFDGGTRVGVRADHYFKWSPLQAGGISIKWHSEAR